MKSELSVTIDNDPIRFTPEGKVFVLDAIRALSDSTDPESLWEELKDGHPEVVDRCEYIPQEDAHLVPIADTDAWEAIQVLLFEIFMEQQMAS
jgi:hypothetical protein